MRPNDHRSSSGKDDDGIALTRKDFLKAAGASLAGLGFAGRSSAATEYYVSSDGSDDNDGQSLESAFATIDHAVSVAGAGDTVNVADGVYKEPQIDIKDVSGAGNRLVIRAMNEHGAHLLSQSSGAALVVQGSATGVTIDGLEVSFPSDTESEMFGILVNGNRVTIQNCYVHDAPFSGIQGGYCDNVVIQNNVVQANAAGTGDENHANGSGISVWNSREKEDLGGYGIVVRNNICYQNRATNPTGGSGSPTDGNGIIIDWHRTASEDTEGYYKPTLVENNVCFDNGGKGINVYNSDNVTVRNNTCYHNTYILDQHGKTSEIAVSVGANCEVVNNIAVVDPERDQTYALTVYDDDTTTTIRHNLLAGPRLFDGDDTNTTLSSDGNFGNQTSTDGTYPEFVNASEDPAVANFRLQAGSPAIDAGYDSNRAPEDRDGKSRPIGDDVDIGAYEFEAPGSAIDGTYRLRNVLSGKVLDVAGAGTSNGDNVQQWEYWGGDNQHWSIDHLGGDRHRLVAQHSGKVAEVYDFASSDGATVKQWSWADGVNQRWHVESVDDGEYRLVAEHSGKAMSVGGTSDGEDVFQWEWTGEDWQRWSLQSVGTLAEGTYRIEAVHSGKVLDVSGSSTDDGANLHQWEYHGDDNQYWQVESVSDGTYRLRAVHSDKVAEVGSGDTGNGANVNQWSYEGYDWQKWRIEDTGGGQYRIEAVHSGKVLDVSGAGTGDGDNVQQWEWADGDNQKWRFVRR